MAIESVKEFARRHGVSRQSVFNWLRRGLIVSTPGGAIDGDASDALLAGRPDVYRGGQVGGNPPRNGNGAREHGTLSAALLRKEEAWPNSASCSSIAKPAGSCWLKTRCASSPARWSWSARTCSGSAQ